MVRDEVVPHVSGFQSRYSRGLYGARSNPNKPTQTGRPLSTVAFEVLSEPPTHFRVRRGHSLMESFPESQSPRGAVWLLVVCLMFRGTATEAEREQLLGT